jgi:ribosomal protein S18 acetylase RimI-like enzyme
MNHFNITISKLTDSDYEGWLPLWNENNFGQVNKDITKTTWARLIDDHHPVNGLVAKIDNKAIGFLHYILHHTTGHIEPVCYMQDVYVQEDMRHNGIAKMLIQYLQNLGHQEKWARLYWLAEKENVAAQSLYKNIGLKLDFTFHVLPL